MDFKKNDLYNRHHERKPDHQKLYTVLIIVFLLVSKYGFSQTSAFAQDESLTAELWTVTEEVIPWPGVP